MPAVLWWAEHSKVSLFPSYSQLYWNALLAKVCEEFSTLTAHHPREPTLRTWKLSSALSVLLGIVPTWKGAKSSNCWLCHIGLAENVGLHGLRCRGEQQREADLGKLVGQAGLHLYPKWFASPSSKDAVSSYLAVVTVANLKTCLLVLLLIEGTHRGMKSFFLSFIIYYILIAMAWCFPVVLKAFGDLNLSYFSLHY